MSNTPVAKRAFSIDDIATLRTVSGVQLSPDGRSVIYVVTSVINNSYQDIITVIDISSGQQKQLIAGSSPQWSPDGTAIAYLADNNGSAAIFTYNLQDNSSELLVNIYESDYFIDHYVNKNFCWFPDGKTIAYVSAAPVSEGAGSLAVREFTHLLYKTKGGRGREIYTDQRHTHIWLIAVKEKIASPVFVSEFNEHSICWSPDGRKICFISNTTGNPDMNQSSDVFATDIITGEINGISMEKGSAFQPAWSPDGLYIAYLGIKSEISTNDSPAEDTQLYIVPSTGGPAKCLTRSLDRRIEQILWEPSSQYIYFTAGDKGTTLLYLVSVLSGEIEAVIDIEGKVTEYSISADGKKIIYVHTGTIHLGDVFIYNVADHFHIKLTGFREELSGKCLLQPAETFWFKSFDNIDIQGWLIRPVHFDESKKYPLILVIHGGPHNMFGYEFEDRMQLLSASGYGVLFMNPRGSSGYGQEFSNGCVKAWGEGDYKDLCKALIWL